MSKPWFLVCGWLIFAIGAAIALPDRLNGLQTLLRDQIEDDLDANALTDIRVTMDGQAATVAYRESATPPDHPRERLLRAMDIVGGAHGEFSRFGHWGGVFMGPVTTVALDEASLSAVQVRVDRALAEASASSASAASLAAAKKCTRDVTRAVASRKLSFVTGSAELTPESDSILKDVVTTLGKCPEGLMLHVEGYTDNVGGLDDNMQLSEKRAGAAADALVRLGVPEPSVVSQGFGPNDPVADNDTETGRAINRRVIFILKPA